MSLQAVKTLSLADQVFEQLGAAILTKQYAAGTNLPAERALVATFKVNRHVVREALKRLQQVGLIKITQGGGARVLDFEHHGGLDLLAMMAEHADAPTNALAYWLAVHEMRVAIGTDVARLCALRANADIRAQLVEIANEMKAIGDGPALLDCEVRFWDTALRGAANIAYRLAFNTLIKGVTAPGINRVMRALAAEEVKACDYRVPIAKAIEAGDADLAESLTREAMRSVVSTIGMQLGDAAPPIFKSTRSSPVADASRAAAKQAAAEQAAAEQAAAQQTTEAVDTTLPGKATKKAAAKKAAAKPAKK